MDELSVSMCIWDLVFSIKTFIYTKYIKGLRTDSCGTPSEITLRLYYLAHWYLLRKLLCACNDLDIQCISQVTLYSCFRSCQPLCQSFVCVQCHIETSS